MLQRKSVKGFLRELASRKPTPGGGSAAALSGAAAAGLISMAAKISKEKEISDKSERIMNVLIGLIDKDAQAFMGGNLKEATETPLQTAKYAYEVLKLAEVLLEKCKTCVVTDIGVAVKLAESTVESALLNVKFNLVLIEDENYKKEILKAADQLCLTGYLSRILSAKIHARLH